LHYWLHRNNKGFRSGQLHTTAYRVASSAAVYDL